MRNGFYGIVGKHITPASSGLKSASTLDGDEYDRSTISKPKNQGKPKSLDAKFKDHHSVGVLVKITDQQQVMSNLVQNYAEFGVEAIQRFRIDRVIMTHDDQIIKVCEITLIDDAQEYQSLPESPERAEMIA